ncbi:leucyl/phenylalanyl-tRNA--protein transferase [Chondromyces apiculatus]|uniref:Leucyl/phenylalanyl-tRNA--protein transferase n=1 Tax=Chondromyces apiculatus DSM 436 TaxID=1192034 RepID=A0A017SZ36_9BACT|nr:leucyl/phenylalanyl-tRNA--protein transferase [Chondromyces apiculatus]EYF02259.1 Leucyl/phenylalanyl-tRNA--protein transferase [Chondromyces apiculatus DSM 436]
MRIPVLTPAIAFPSPERATPEGIVAVGGDASPERLLAAYNSGIFPWPHEGLPLLWFCPDPRFVLVPTEAHLPRSLRKRARRGPYEVRTDTAFAEVMRGCSEVPRPGQDGTWITEELMAGYVRLHALGYAHSIECWQEDRLVGGLYGVSLGGLFFGESMFARAPDASKVAFATLLGNLVHWGFDLVDCQAYTTHLERFGAVEWPRRRFLRTLRACLERPTRMGPWRFELSPAEAVDLLRRDEVGAG